MRIVSSLVGGPVNAFRSLAACGAQGDQGANNIGTYNKTPVSYRKWCRPVGAMCLRSIRH